MKYEQIKKWANKTKMNDQLSVSMGVDECFT